MISSDKNIIVMIQDHIQAESKRKKKRIPIFSGYLQDEWKVAIVAIALAVVGGGGKVYDHGQFSSFRPFVVT